MEAKKNTDTWFPVTLYDTSQDPVTGKVFGDVACKYSVGGATSLTTYTVLTADWKEAGEGKYWLNIGASEFTAEGNYEVSIAVTDAVHFNFPVECVDNTLAEMYDVINTISSNTGEIGVAGAGLTNINLPNQTMDITGNLSGSVGSVSGAVGSVSGNVDGNVTGSVGSVTGAVGSVAGNVDGNVTGSVGSVTGEVDIGKVKGAGVTDVGDFKADVSNLDTTISSRSAFDSTSDEIDIGKVKGVAVTSVADFKANVSGLSTFDSTSDEVDIGKVKGAGVTDVGDFKANITTLALQATALAIKAKTDGLAPATIDTKTQEEIFEIILAMATGKFTYTALTRTFVFYKQDNVTVLYTLVNEDPGRSRS